MKTVDVTFQNLDSSEISLTDVSHYFDSDPTKLGEHVGRFWLDLGILSGSSCRRLAAPKGAQSERTHSARSRGSGSLLTCGHPSRLTPALQPPSLPFYYLSLPLCFACSGWPARRRQDALRLHRRHHHRQRAGKGGEWGRLC